MHRQLGLKWRFGRPSLIVPAVVAVETNCSHAACPDMALQACRQVHLLVSRALWQSFRPVHSLLHCRSGSQSSHGAMLLCLL